MELGGLGRLDRIHFFVEHRLGGREKSPRFGRSGLRFGKRAPTPLRLVCPDTLCPGYPPLDAPRIGDAF